MELTPAEENYLKGIYGLEASGISPISTNELADLMQTKPASVTDMLKKLARKGMISYVRYQGVHITSAGKKKALEITRRRKLWEVFLVEKLRLHWDELAGLSDALEHISSPLLIQRMDEFLGYPKFDPFGDPIPNEYGEISSKPRVPVLELKIEQSAKIIAVSDNSSSFLKYLDKAGLFIGAKVLVLDKVDFDGSMELLVENKKRLFISKEVAANILTLPF
ncbi:Mn-dependent transcriptional regulator MntR [Lunatimonas lonarensis]|uniref:Transcriptional regulator MntR n=1 Tax=Lunatimonas lonarensis TaxID=1232681 RepID=R7ZZ28_9BACT|nr:metal-dependent transcriptional regulator [Lunatimonas lonarensis]EON79351.1 Mn-dependent transcriptional regulator MntR [Lunatimonas lonarensis]